MINFSAVKSVTIPEGVVTKIELDGRAIWALQSDKPVVLQVEKITSDTYAAETTYKSEQFILFDIYPKTNGTVKVTYGGLTKTITDTSGAAEPNAQQVFFGTFNGVSDSVTTPASGELVIEGDWYAFGCGSFQNGSKNTNIGYCNCITAVTDWGTTTVIPDHAFYYCNNVDFSIIPEGITSIGASAFVMDFDGTISVPEWLTPITSVTIPSTVESIGDYAFSTKMSYAVGTGFSDGYLTYIKTLVLLPTTPPTLGTYACVNWDRTNHIAKRDIAIIVPKGCGDIYKAAGGWSVYGDYITEAE